MANESTGHSIWQQNKRERDTSEKLWAAFYLDKIYCGYKNGEWALTRWQSRGKYWEYCNKEVSWDAVDKELATKYVCFWISQDMFIRRPTAFMHKHVQGNQNSRCQINYNSALLKKIKSYFIVYAKKLMQTVKKYPQSTLVHLTQRHFKRIGHPRNNFLCTRKKIPDDRKISVNTPHPHTKVAQNPLPSGT